MSLDTGNEAWKSKAASKRAFEASKIPKEWRLAPEFLRGNEHSDLNVIDVPAKSGILTPAELNITERYTAVSLAQAVQSGALSAADVAVAFCKRAAIAQQVTNCLTETFFDDAIARGQYLDGYLAKHKRPVGPLHGVPVSLKDMINYKGVQSTLGLVSFLDHPPAEQNCALVDILLELGAILYCKTNVPQTMMSADSDNNVFGRTMNPHRLTLTAGGSSGGEGALVAMRGSILGVGTDIGGSVRIPALCCGTYGFKPSAGRIPYGGFETCSRRGSPGFPSVAGPLTNAFEDMAFFMENVISKKPWDRDATTLPILWHSNIAGSIPTNLRIGYFLEEPTCKVTPPVVRALETTAQKLSAAGITVIPIPQVPSFQTALELCSDSWSLDNTKTSLRHIQAGGEPVIPSVQKSIGSIAKKPDGYTVDEIFDLNVAKIAYKTQWNDIFAKNQLDVLLCPGAAHTAVPHDQYGVPPYTALWNLLEYPGAIIPVGFADSSIDKDELARPDLLRPYSAKEIHGAPLSVQVIARSYQDEQLIAAARIIDQILRA